MRYGSPSEFPSALPFPGDALPGSSLLSWIWPTDLPRNQLALNVTLDMGWGRLIFAHTFEEPAELVHELSAEQPGKRDIAFYVRDPHVLVSMSPHRLFLDPSHTYRLWLDRYDPPDRPTMLLNIRRARTREDAAQINRIYASRHMVQVDPKFIEEHADDPKVLFVLAEHPQTGEPIGTAAGVDHKLAFNDVEAGASLWSIAVDSQAPCSGVGPALVRHLVDHFAAAGRMYVDLSVLHDNRPAISMYEKLGFERVPVFCLKHKNAINEPLFAAAAPEANLNPYARIIVDEARLRGIAVEVLDEEANYFALTYGGRRIVCRESLSELTSAVAMSRCDDKRVTTRILKNAGLCVPAQAQAATAEQNLQILERFKRVVVKPARGEQGRGISVDVRTPEHLEAAVARARQECEQVIIEQFCEGMDLRIVVIGFKVVAAAIRRPPQIVGDGVHTIRQLIEHQSRRRMAATGGQSQIPIDGETERCVVATGHTYDTVLPQGEVVTVRKAANLHTGGTIHDVTDQLHPTLADAAVRAARAIDIPVTGLDFLVPQVDGPEYVIVEANERPGLANHEPQPTAQRFVDLLFPQTAT